MLTDYWDRLGWCNVVPRTPIVFFTGDGLEVFLDTLLSLSVCSDRTQEDYCRSDSVTIMGVWSDGFSCARGPLSISQLSSRSASVGDNKK